MSYLLMFCEQTHPGPRGFAVDDHISTQCYLAEMTEEQLNHLTKLVGAKFQEYIDVVGEIGERLKVEDYELMKHTVGVKWVELGCYSDATADLSYEQALTMVENLVVWRPNEA